jgi:tripartite-type tricarboxylate transporter receptor subunit TctC
MKRFNDYRKLRGGVLTVILIALISVSMILIAVNSAMSATLKDAAKFYKGKNLALIVPNKPGGGYDTYCRLLAPYLSKYTGANVIVKNQPGAGGLMCVNGVYEARPDGLRINIQNTMASVTNQLVGLEGVRYDLLKYSWLGRVTTDRRVLTMRKNAPVKSFAELMKSSKIIKLGATGVGGSTYVDAVITKEAFNLPVEVVFGYDSSPEVDLGLLRGEIDGTYGSYNSRLSMVKAGEQFIVVQSGKDRASYMPDVPNWFEFAKDDRAKKLLTALNGLHETGRTLSTTPGIPAERLAFLRQAFEKTMNDPEFLNDAKKAKRDLDYLAGDDVLQLMKDVLSIDDPQVKKIFVNAVKGEM